MAYLRYCKNVPYASGRPTYKMLLQYWREQLFNYCSKLFTWDGLDFKQKEIESRLIVRGYCGFFMLGNKQMVAYCNMNGLTDFYDEFTDFTFNTAKISGRRKIGIDGVVVDNTSLRNPTFEIIEHYAMQLAHIDISFVNALVNGRASKTAVVGNDKTANNVRQYLDDLYNGKLNPITDPALLNITFQDNDSNSLTNIMNLLNARQNTLYSFFEDIGVKKSQTKRERLISDEVAADNGILKLNLKDMLDARQLACDEINKLFGLNISVKCNVDIDDDGIPEAEENDQEGGFDESTGII